MATARTERHDRLAWNHTSCLLAVLINVNRDPKKAPVKPEELNPYTAAKGGAGSTGVPITADNIRDLKAVFARKK